MSLELYPQVIDDLESLTAQLRELDRTRERLIVRITVLNFRRYLASHPRVWADGEGPARPLGPPPRRRSGPLPKYSQAALIAIWHALTPPRSIDQMAETMGIRRPRLYDHLMRHQLSARRLIALDRGIVLS